LSPMVIASCSLSGGMLPPFLEKSKTIAAGSMSGSPFATGARPAGSQRSQRVRYPGNLDSAAPDLDDKKYGAREWRRPDR
jgi:hypothetical protein